MAENAQVLHGNSEKAGLVGRRFFGYLLVQLAEDEQVNLRLTLTLADSVEVLLRSGEPGISLIQKFAELLKKLTRQTGTFWDFSITRM